MLLVFIYLVSTNSMMSELDFFRASVFLSLLDSSCSKVTL